jgi:hypothetical protein
MMVLEVMYMRHKYFNHVVLALLVVGGCLLASERSGNGAQVLSCTSGVCEACHAQRVSSGVQGSTGQSADDLTDATAATGSITTGNSMLRGSDPSSTCLLCHQAPKGTLQPQGYCNTTSQDDLLLPLPPAQLTPAGDYGWLKKNYRWQSENGAMESSPGERHGHNIVAFDFNFNADTRQPVAPGGTYASVSLSCISCHDPHGNFRRSADGTISSSGLPVIGSGSYSNSPNPDASGSVLSYRMLAGKGYQPKSLPSIAQFTADPPAAVAPPTYNRAETASDTRVAYGSGMSEWCQNCHSQIHSNGAAGAMGHPAGNTAKFSERTASMYNYYVKSGNLTGAAGNSYSSLVPYEMGTNDYAVLKAAANSNGSNLSGPGSGDSPNVMCLSCHRAHASGWDSMTRWNTQSTFLVYNERYPGLDNGAPAPYAQGRTEAETRKTFYDRPASQYASGQRSLCNKCHGRD